MSDEIPDWLFLLDTDYDYTEPPFNTRRTAREVQIFLKVLRQMDVFWLNLRRHGPYMLRFMCPYCGLPFSTHERKPPSRRQG
ncbi:unnamed protein product [Pieris macdunnoughi]|uniref:Uncharacterized protein n=1 Tax=Pieris macdunnoughi TaxID=345717 RepID=A0A821LI85_9NEOP|nr:unnamed protein product [Pieris macdunnoughi]